MRSSVFAVAGAKGGVGKTTTAINLAASLEAAGVDAVVVELDLAMANVVDFLDLGEVDATLHDILAGDATPHRAIYRHGDSFSVVPSGTDLSGFASVDLDRLPAVIGTLKDRFDAIVLDTGAGVSRETIEPLKLADATVLVSTPRVASVRDTNKTRQLVERVDGTVAGLVLTQSGTADSPGAARISEFLGADVLGHVPEDDAVPASQHDGEPVVVHSPDSAAASAYGRVTDRLLETWADASEVAADEAPGNDGAAADDERTAPDDTAPEAERPAATDADGTGPGDDASAVPDADGEADDERPQPDATASAEGSADADERWDVEDAAAESTPVDPAEADAGDEASTADVDPSPAASAPADGSPSEQPADDTSGRADAGATTVGSDAPPEPATESDAPPEPAADRGSASDGATGDSDPDRSTGGEDADTEQSAADADQPDVDEQLDDLSVPGEGQTDGGAAPEQAETVVIPQGDSDEPSGFDGWDEVDDPLATPTGDVGDDAPRDPADETGASDQGGSSDDRTGSDGTSDDDGSRSITERVLSLVGR